MTLTIKGCSADVFLDLMILYIFFDIVKPWYSAQLREYICQLARVAYGILILAGAYSSDNVRTAKQRHDTSQPPDSWLRQIASFFLRTSCCSSASLPRASFSFNSSHFCANLSFSRSPCIRVRYSSVLCIFSFICHCIRRCDDNMLHFSESRWDITTACSSSFTESVILPKYRITH